MASIVACSLHPMDVRLLRQFISAMQGGPIPDFKIEVTRRAHRDLLVNWSQKVAKAARPLAKEIPPAQWLLYTQLRPFFITTDNPEQAAALAERFFTVETQDDVINLFREEVARIDADRADDIIDAAQQDSTPGPLAHFSPGEVAEHVRAYLLYERRQLETLATAVSDGTLPKEQLTKAARLLAWRTCNLLANMHPSWQTRTTTLTDLASRQELGLAPLMADPRGMYAGIAQRIPGLHEEIPYYLSAELQTGLCINPRSIPVVLSQIKTWPSPIASHPTLSTPEPVEIQALQEALIYAQLHEAGLWEAAGLINPAQGIFPQILADQGNLDERLEATIAEPVAAIASVSSETAMATVSVPENMPPQSVDGAENDFERKWEDTTPVDQSVTEEPATADPKTPWFKKLFKKK